MPFYEYRNHRVNGRSVPPEFIDNSLHLNKSDGTDIAYIPDNRDYYIPDTLLEVTVEEVKERALEIHRIIPFGPLHEDKWTDAQVLNWIDSVVQKYS
jgi:hypothetical protein